tara:strand:- start:1660 stop:2304 length:645 start_codon:yes stop_codon:yes gene_type:complete
MNGTCPNGYICINHTNAIIIIIILLAVMYIINKESYKKIFMDKQDEDIEIQHQQLVQQNILNQQQILEQKQQMMDQQISDHDRKVVSNPLYPPLKRGIPINIETRESGGEFQQVGILSKNNINDGAAVPGNNTDSVVLPLYGKPTYRGSNKWLYYTETDKLNPVKIPVNHKNKDCTDDYGCDEIYDKDSVTIPSYNGDFNVKIYKLNKPRYIPY